MHRDTQNQYLHSNLTSNVETNIKSTCHPIEDGSCLTLEELETLYMYQEERLLELEIWIEDVYCMWNYGTSEETAIINRTNLDRLTNPVVSVDCNKK